MKPAACALVLVLFACTESRTPDPLPSWHAGPAKAALIQFVDRVTRAGSPDLVPIAERIAVFDNDGTLWAEQPMYAQLAFALDRAKQLGTPRTPAIRSEKDVAELIALTHANTTTDEFERIVTTWIASAQHPTLHRRYTELVYAPMMELLAYLRSRGFVTYVVSGGGVDFIRPWSDAVYGIPRNQIIGSRVKLKYEVRDGAPILARLPDIDLVDDKAGKPVGIQQTIGRRPILAFGNSDGDFEMLEWVTSGQGARLGLILHHTDATREFAYDRESSVGRLSRALDEATARNWIVVDMKRDWNRVFR